MNLEKPRAEIQYLDWAQTILDEGEPTDDRTNVGTLDLFGEAQMRYDLRAEFPLLTTKNVATRAIRHELAWMLDGDTNLRYLAENNVHIWDEWPFTTWLKSREAAAPEQGSDEWNALKSEFIQRIIEDDDFAREYGELGPIYGHQWRAWQGPDGKAVDQLQDVQDHIRNVDNLKGRKYGRRLIVSAWNAGDIEAMERSGLPPCHTLFQFNAPKQTDPETGKKYLDLQLYQRSADWFLGVPFNMAQYAMLLSAMAQTTERTPRYLYHTFGSAHVYKNHIDQVNEQLGRRDQLFDAPHLELNPDVTDIGRFEADDFRIVGYRHHAAIKGQVAI
ncbi:thymidylate synthase [Candidatus Saccharibacteria bacterium]|nr:thymidylate synthase [Candidatus Saccharibacteria bacterium]